MRWTLSHRADPLALPLADRHYNRQKVGSPQFVPPGRCLVFRSYDDQALWVTSWPFAEYVKHAWAGAWVNSLFRREGGIRGSDMIRQAVAATRSIWEAPELGIVSFVDPDEVKPTAITDAVVRMTQLDSSQCPRVEATKGGGVNGTYLS